MEARKEDGCFTGTCWYWYFGVVFLLFKKGFFFIILNYYVVILCQICPLFFIILHKVKSKANLSYMSAVMKWNCCSFSNSINDDLSQESSQRY